MTLKIARLNAKKTLTAGFALILVGVMPALAQGGSHLNDTLDKMNAASKKFKSAQADLHKDLFDAAVKETTSQQGTVYFIRNGKTTQMGAKLMPPTARVLEYKDGKLNIYDPNTNHLQVVSAANNQAQVESFLTLGFGGSGDDLKQAWTIDDQGQESVGGVKAEKLSLTPKEPSVRNMFTNVVLWIDLDRGVSLKQKFTTPEGDTQTATYANIRYNSNVDMKAFEIKCKGKCN